MSDQVPVDVTPAPPSLKAHLEAAKAKILAPAPADAPPAPAPAPAEKTGAALAKLAREQRAAREAQEQLKAQRAELEKQRADIEKQRADYQGALSQSKRFPLKFLEANGLTAMDVNEALLNDGEPTVDLELKAVRDEVNKFRQEQEQREKQLVEQQRKQAEAQEAEVLKRYQAECAAFVDKNAEKYELTAKLEQQHLVFQTIDEVYRQSEAAGTPRLLSIEEAAEEVEKSLMEMAEKVAGVKKLTAKQSTPAPSSESYAARRARILKGLI